MRKPKEAYSIQTVVNAMRLLEEFRDEEELGVTALAKRLGLHKNNHGSSPAAHRNPGQRAR